MTIFVELLIINFVLFVFLCVSAFVMSRTKSKHVKNIFCAISVLCIIFLFFALSSLMLSI